jgi:hypothetical protein
MKIKDKKEYKNIGQKEKGEEVIIIIKLRNQKR